MPTPCLMDQHRLRLFYGGLDEKRHGRIGFVDVNAARPGQVLAVSTEPVLDLGEIGCFDDCGVVPSYAHLVAGRCHLYYVGFQRAERVPYMIFSGLAIENEHGHFERVAQTPILDRSPLEPFSRGAPWLFRDQQRWRMWYWSCTGWRQGQQGLHYVNQIRCAESEDGLNWKVHQEPCLAPSGADFSLGRPSVWRGTPFRDHRWRMWFSIRAQDIPYRMGYAESEDGVNWKRNDALAGLLPSATGWDSQMMCYPALVFAGGRLLLFYNGNGMGQSGFGYAEWQVS